MPKIKFGRNIKTAPIAVRVPEHLKEYYQKVVNEYVMNVYDNNVNVNNNGIVVKLKRILTKFIPAFLEHEIDIELSDSEYAIVRELYEKLIGSK